MYNKKDTLLSKFISIMVSCAMIISSVPTEAIARTFIDDSVPDISTIEQNNFVTNVATEKSSWKVHYDANGAENVKLEDMEIEKDKTSIEVYNSKDIQRVGYTLVGWATTPGNQTIEDDITTSEIDESIENIFVPLSASLYNLSYKYIELTDEDIKTDKYTVIHLEDGRNISLVNDGFVKGLEYDETHIVQEESLLDVCGSQIKDDVTTDIDLILYAVWKPITYTIKYHANGGFGEMADVTSVAYDKNYELDKCAFTYDGHEFDGWNTQADGSGQSYSDGEKVKNLTDKADYVIDLWAQWKESNKIEEPKTQVLNTSTGNKDDKNEGFASGVIGDDVSAFIVEGAAVQNEQAATNALRGVKGVTSSSAPSIARNLMGAPLRSPASGDPSVPRQLDGSNIESISAKWITEDSVDNGDESLLYRKPDGDEKQTVKLRINYALSGEHDYPKETIQIVVPKFIFKNRRGRDYGRLIIPYPEEPNSSDDFMWSERNDGTYVLTNQKQMSAATKGYIEFAFTDLTPHELVDMQVSGDFDARIDVLTHKDNLISLTSNKLKAVFDTEEVVDSATKYEIGGINWVGADDIPVSQRVLGETEYVVVTYYMYCHIYGNTAFTLDMVDSMPNEYNGFIIDATSSDGLSKNVNDLIPFKWELPGIDGYQTVQVAYPGSQFQPDTVYTFHNNVEYILTEVDPAVGSDPQKVTRANDSATVSFVWHTPTFNRPTGHFMVNKIGNDDYYAEKPYWTHSYNEYDNYDIYKHNTDDGYGIYPSALNDIIDGEDVEIAYTVESIGYILPWTCEGDYKVLENYGKRPVRMVTYDTDETLSSPFYLSGNVPLTLGTDYEYKAVEFPVAPEIGLGTAINLQPDGSFVALHAEDGAIEYARDGDMSHIPDVTLEAKLANDTWVNVAKASWSSGSLNLQSLRSDCTVTNYRVTLPAGTKQIRTSVTSTNAYIWYYIRPIFTLHPSTTVCNVADGLFEVFNQPSVGVFNSTYMKAYDNANTELVDIHKTAMDRLDGYSTKIRVYPEKRCRQDLADVDYGKRCITLHYSADVEENSYIGTRAGYNQAIADGRLIPETEGIWYDLLPKGMTPDTASVELRDSDQVIDAYTIENYKDSGRTMLIVKTRMKPQVEFDRDSLTYKDILKISFDATYNFESLKDYGDTVHNVIAYESLSRNPIGNVEDYGGEEDNPYGTGNIATSRAFIDNNEKDLMKDLDTTRTGARFVYAGVTTILDALSAARTSLSKDIQVNYDGRWSNGTYDDKRTVYEGGWYNYRLRMMSDADTQSKDLVLYDSLENFYAGDGNDPNDIGAPRWQGEFCGLDLSQLEDAGVKPVVYYSTVTNLQLSDETDPRQGHPTNLNLNNASVWTKATDYTGALSNVKAIAIDCSKKVDNSDFVLEPEESIAVIVNMHAPSGSAARTYISQKGIWGDSAHAYNNAYLTCTSIDVETHIADSDNFVRKDYTKVGLKEYNLSVHKRWDDADNRDGMRPESVIVKLMANGSEVSRGTLSDTNDWEYTFENLAYTDNMGEKIHYSFEEVPVNGYTASVVGAFGHYIMTNKHEAEKISIKGEKKWQGDTTNSRPQFIYVHLYKRLINGDVRLVDTRKVYPSMDGVWSYEFDGLYKYEDGQLIDYFIEEEGSESYIATINGFDIINEYHPYGNLQLTKHVEGATATFANRSFDIGLVLQTEAGLPLTGSYVYQIKNANGSVASSGNISNGNRFNLKDGQTIYIKDLPEFTKYEFTENVPAGYEITSSMNLNGSIIPNTDNIAELTNTYHAEGQVAFGATKTLANHDMKALQFKFRVLDEDDNIVRSSANDKNGNVVFGVIRYTQADAGHIYNYRIIETDRGKGGYTYDNRVYTATVSVSDNGDGTLNITSVYKNPSNTVVNLPEFANEYHAIGSVQLRAWKQLLGGNIASNTFTFELLNQSGTVLQTKNCDSYGSVIFNNINYTEADGGHTYYYAVREKNTGVTGITYDNSLFGYKVVVIDNNDGTISTTISYANVTQNGSTLTFTDSNTAPIPLFTNKVKPGELAIQKTVNSSTPQEHKTDEFEFHVKMTGQDLPDTVEYTLVPASGSITGVFGGLFDGVKSLFEPTVAYADIAGGTDDGLTWRITDDGELILGNGGTQTWRNGYDYWDSYKYQIKKISINGTVIYDYSGLRFDEYPNVEEIDLSGLDTSNVTSLSWAFRRCPKLRIINAPDLDTTQVTSLYQMCQNCESLETLDVSNWNVSNVRNFCETFEGCNKLQVLDVSNWNTRSVTNMDHAFDGCSKLQVLDVSNWNTSNVTTMEETFSGCSSLVNLDVSSWNTSSVTNMIRMFYSCRLLESIEGLSNWNTSSVTNMQSMFSYCDKLQSLDVSNWNTSNVTNMKSMFSYSKQLQSLNVSNWNTGNVTNMVSLFEGCSSLESLNLSNWDTSSVTDMQSMFRSCGKLQSLDVSNWDTGKVTNMEGIFGNCELLGVIEGLSDWDTSKVTTMRNMFSYCSNLEFLDIFDWNTGSVTTMDSMFENCEKLQLPDVFNWNTSNVEYMQYMFYKCKNLNELHLSNWDTSSVVNMSSMFEYCENLELLDISTWDTRNVLYVNKFLASCYSLMYLDLSSINWASVTSMGDYYTSPYYSLNPQTIVIGAYNPFVSGNGSTAHVNGARKWINVEKDTEALTNEELATVLGYEVDSSYQGTWVRETLGTTITFDANGGLGSMEPQFIESGTTANLNANTFTMPIMRFGGWNTEANGSGTAYDNEDSITGSTTEHQRITLYAQWIPPAVSINVVDGEFDVTIPAGKKAVFENLPAGTSYVVIEKPKAGWTLTSQTDASGTIQSDTLSVAKFNNSYNVNQTSAQISGVKMIDEDTAANNAYSFRLYEGSNLLQTVYNKAGGGIQFNPITYTTTGNHTYTIQEVAGSSSSIVYDEHTETVQVNVTRVGGALSANVTYDSTGVVFNNRTAPGKLVVQKNVEGASTANANDEFTFVVKLQTAKGAPINNAQIKYNETNTTVTPTGIVNGMYTVKLKGGNSLEFLDLPSGAMYTVEETNIPTGWVLRTSSNMSGTITTGGTKTAIITNKYTPNGEVVIKVWKKLLGRFPEYGEFNFELLNASNNNVLQTVSNDTVDMRTTMPAPDGESMMDNPHVRTAPVVFSPISYTSTGDYRYIIREVAGSDTGITYDDKTIKVTVHVTDAGHGNLNCEVEYEGNEDTFVNEMDTGELVLNKVVDGEVDNTEFTFDVTLKTPSGENIPDGTYTGQIAPAYVEADVEPRGLTPSSQFNHDEVENDIITFDANGGYFADRYKQNAVEYKNSSSVSSVTKYSHTPNVNDAGEQSGNYANSLQLRDVVTIPNSGSLNATITYGTENNYDMLYVFAGTYTGDISRNMSAGQLYTFMGNSGTPTTVDITIPGDTATFAFYSDSSNNGYGYYAVVTGTNPPEVGDHGEYMEPLPMNSHMTFAGWYTDEACTDGHEFNLNSYTVTGNRDFTVYAKWVENPYHIEKEFEVEDGVMTVSLLGGESFKMSDLADGTTYKIVERPVENWQQTSSRGTEGEIVSGATSKAIVHNRKDKRKKRNPGSFSINGKKVLNGGDLAAGEFAFLLYDSEDRLIAKAYNDANGDVSFSNIAVSTEDIGKTLEYYIVEDTTTDSNIVFDTTKYEFTVTVAYDEAQGMIVTTVSDPAGFTFTNRKIEPGSFTVRGKKFLTGGDLEANQFRFLLYDSEDRLVASKYNDANGNVVFDDIEVGVDAIGKTLSYYIIEDTTTADDVVFDTNRYEFTVVITYNESQGKIVATLSDTSGFTFTNRMNNYSYMPMTGMEGVNEYLLWACMGLVIFSGIVIIRRRKRLM